MTEELLANVHPAGTNEPLAILTTGITSGATILPTSLGLPEELAGTGHFRLLLGSEIIIATKGPGEKEWSVVERGADNTTAAAHVAGTKIFHVLTKGALEAAFPKTVDQPLRITGTPTAGQVLTATGAEAAEWAAGGGGGGGGGSEGGGATPVGPAETIAALNGAFPGGPPDGQVGLIRVGSGADQEDIEVTFDEDRGLWVGAERVVMRNTDQNGPTIGFYNLSQLGRSFSTGLASGAWWSFASAAHVNAAMGAGLGIEYRHHGFLLADSSGAGINIGVRIYQLNDGDPNPSIFDQPIEGGWAQTGFIEGGGAHGSADYQWRTSDWETLLAVGGGALPAATKTSLYCALVGTVDHPGSGEPTGNGAIIDYGLFTRYVG